MDDVRRVADYVVIAGLPENEKPQLLDEYSLEVNLKPSAYQDPITDITVIAATIYKNERHASTINFVPGHIS